MTRDRRSARDAAFPNRVDWAAVRGNLRATFADARRALDLAVERRYNGELRASLEEILAGLRLVARDLGAPDDWLEGDG